jgi:outer membrane protein
MRSQVLRIRFGNGKILSLQLAMQRMVTLSSERRKPLFFKLMLLVLAAGILAACTAYSVSTPREEPPLPREEILRQWQGRAKKALDASQGPLTVERAIEEALAASPELEQVRQRIGAAAEQVRQADATFYPRLVVSEEYNITNNPVFALMDIFNQRRFQPNIDFNNPGTQQNFGTGIRGDWSLFEGGRHWYDRKAAVAQQRSVGAELLAARNQLVAKVTEVYYQWLQALAFTGVAERALESAQTDVRLGEARLHAEAALPSEVLRLRARRAEAHGNLVTAHTNARKLQAGLERLIVRPIQPGEVPNPGMSAVTVVAADLQGNSDQYVEVALDKRPEMAAVRSLIQAARERVRSSQGGLLPRLGSNVQYALDSQNLGSFADSWFAAVQVTWPLFEGGVSMARIQEARSRLKEIEARGEQLALDIALEVTQASLAVREAAEKIQVAEERKRWAEKALGEVRQIYAKQAATVDSLLQAELAWNQAEVSYTAALYEGKIAQAFLRRALGDFAEGLGVSNGQ